jgi:hypothetical protein
VVFAGADDLLAHYEIGCEVWQGKERSGVERSGDLTMKGLARQSRNQIRKKIFTTKDTKSTKLGVLIIRTFVSFVIFVVWPDLQKRRQRIKPTANLCEHSTSLEFLFHFAFLLVFFPPMLMLSL